MDYGEIEAYLLDLPRFTEKNSLTDTGAFLKRLGDPCGDKTIVHIAGTNGKGSVCAYLSSVLSRCGYRTGMFTSPHLVSMRERFRLCGRMIGRREFEECFVAVNRELESGAAGRAGYRPTFFETLFFMAMVWFEREGAEVVLLETGLGGRLDATNSLPRKDLCVITQIGLDHMERLGGSVAEIAGEKAGILRKNVPVVYADGKNEASGVIAERAAALGCPAYPVSKNGIQNLDFHKKSIDFSYQTRYYGYVRCKLNTVARYQAENAALALKALDVLSETLPLTGEGIVRGMEEARWEGRMEEILPGVYVDGAHNPDGVRAFLETVGQDGCAGRRYLLFSAVSDKQYREMIGLLGKAGLFSESYAVELKNKRGLPVSALKRTFAEETGSRIAGFADTRTAFYSVLQKKREEDKLYIAGSLYLAGEIKALLEEFL